MAIEHLASRAVGSRTQAQSVGLALTAQVKVAVLETGLLAHLSGGGRIIDLERQRGGPVEHLKVGDVDFDFTRGQVRVRRPLWTRLDDAGDLDAVLGAQVVGALSHLGLTEDHLGNARAVAQVDEDDATVVAAARHPTG